MPICLQYMHSGFFIYEFLFSSTKMKAEVPVCINHTDFENNWLEPHKWGCGLYSSDLWWCICCEWCLEWKPGTPLSATSICYYACVHCYAHFFKFSSLGYMFYTFPLYVIFFKYALENIHNLFKVFADSLGVLLNVFLL